MLRDLLDATTHRLFSSDHHDVHIVYAVLRDGTLLSQPCGYILASDGRSHPWYRPSSGEESMLANLMHSRMNPKHIPRERRKDKRKRTGRHPKHIEKGFSPRYSRTYVPLLSPIILPTRPQCFFAHDKISQTQSFGSGASEQSSPEYLER